MPYDRKKFDLIVDKVATMHGDAVSVGDMNYLVTGLVHAWIKNHGLNYTNCNAMIGMLDCAKAEFFRCVVTQTVW